MPMTQTKQDHGQANAQAWYETIKGLVAGLHEADEMISPSNCAAYEAVREEIQEGPLSIMVRDGWRQPGITPGCAVDGPEEFEILLSTGGPALRIWGTLDKHDQPDECELQHQDWGTPWTRWVPEPYDPEYRDTLRAYASCFYFGD